MVTPWTSNRDMPVRIPTYSPVIQAKAWYLIDTLGKCRYGNLKLSHDDLVPYSYLVFMMISGNLSRLGVTSEVSNLSLNN
jgi:hypothetical protein